MAAASSLAGGVAEYLHGTVGRGVCAAAHGGRAMGGIVGAMECAGVGKGAMGVGGSVDRCMGFGRELVEETGVVADGGGGRGIWTPILGCCGGS